MPDIKNASSAQFVDEEDIRRSMELMYFSYRRFTQAADHILADHGLGRAHHRALYFIGRHPGMSVKDLLAMLEVTKQSLAGVLKTLIQNGIVESQIGYQDRRERRLSLTTVGKDLEQKVTQAQMHLLHETFISVGPKAVMGFQAVMMGLVPDLVQRSFLRLSDTNGPKS